MIHFNVLAKSIKRQGVAKNFLVKFGCAISLALILTTQCAPSVAALSPAQLKLFQQNINYFDIDACATPSDSASDTTVSVDGETTGPPKAVQKVVWNTLTGGGIDPLHAAAVMGNISVEGVWNPESTEIAGPLGGKPSKDPHSVGTYGYGLIGWTPGTRLLDMMQEANISGKPYTAETQAAVILAAIQGKTPSQYTPDVGKRFLEAKTIEAATTAYQGTDAERGFENPADKTGSLPERISAAKRFLRQYGRTTGSAPAITAAGGGGGAACCPTSGSSDPGGSTTLTGDTNAEKIFNYLKDSAGLTDSQAAGAVGGLMLESGGNTLNIDPTATNPSSSAYGIAQWLPGSRLSGLESLAAKNGTEKSDLLTQVQYLVKEMESNINGYVNDDYKNKKTLGDAVKYWTDWFEGLAYSPDQQFYSERTDNAHTLLNSVSGGDGVSGDSVTPATSGGSCTCPAGSTAVDGKTVVVDPGHGPSKTTVDTATGLTMVESDNQPEGHDVWEVANKVKNDLSGQGYNVILTKKAEDDNVTFRQRAEVAADNNAALALSIHGDPGLPDSGEIFVQKTGLYRGSGSNKTTFNDSAVAQKSQQYAQVFKEEREKAEGGSVVIKDNSFDGRAGLEPGNIPMVQLFAKTPWVYNESKMPFNKDKYAQGLENAIKKILDGGAVADTVSADCGGAVSGDLTATLKGYAWPTYSGSRLDPKPGYKAAFDKAKSQGQYYGNGYTDCGAFVTRALIDSGYEPNYNYGGKLSAGAGPTYGGQIDWLKANWQKVTVNTTKDLEPGDVAINDDHTYLYMGSDGFKGYDSVSASSGGRVPMASSAYDLGAFNWYRKK